jgi:DNA-binding transcriptional regulator YiaG
MEDIRKEYQGKKLRAKREAFFMTQPELAEKIGVSVTTVNLWEIGYAPFCETNPRK